MEDSFAEQESFRLSAAWRALSAATYAFSLSKLRMGLDSFVRSKLITVSLLKMSAKRKRKVAVHAWNTFTTSDGSWRNKTHNNHMICSRFFFKLECHLHAATSAVLSSHTR